MAIESTCGCGCRAGDADRIDRRDFLRSAGVAAVAIGAAQQSPRIWAETAPALSAAPTAESHVKLLFDSLTAAQKTEVCFDWNHIDAERGLLRTRVANNWKITKPDINSEFYTAEQRALVRSIFEAMTQPEWHERFDRQLQDDAGGFGEHQSLAIFGRPGESQFEFVLTGRHMTLRCDGNSADHVAFGGPIFYGHAAGGNFNEAADHPGNVFWPQAVAANQLFQMLDGRQRKLALVEKGLPREENVGFRGPEGSFQGVPVTELSSDQQDHLQGVLKKLLDPYRQADQDEVVSCLQAQGGLRNCHLAFYAERDIGSDQVWDNWRLEGPAFVWHFRGSPHVHVWVNVASDPAVKLNA
jgi:hypothetical protein